MLCTTCALAQAPAVPSLLPQPGSIKPIACEKPVALNRALRFGQLADPGGFELLRERWTALGIPSPVLSAARNERVGVGFTIAPGGLDDAQLQP